MQTEELSSSRALLEAERVRYRTLFEHAPVAYVAEGTIFTLAVTTKHANCSTAFERLDGRSRSPQQQGPPHASAAHYCHRRIRGGR